MQRAPNNDPTEPRGDEVIVCASGPAAAYLATEIMTATPGRLAALLYDAAIRLCEQGLEAIDDGDVERAAECLSRARGTIARLERLTDCRGPGAMVSMPSAKWARVYEQLSDQLVHAAAYRSREAVTAILAGLRARRASWDAFLHATAPAADGNSGWVG